MSSETKQPFRPVNSAVWLLLVFHLFLMISFAYYRFHSFPEPADDSYIGFSETRARYHLDRITSFVSRPAGSEANEKLAAGYILQQIEQIKLLKSSNLVEYDVQRVSGSFGLDFLGGFTSVYENLQNILVRVRPEAGFKHSLLINCHFDSVVGSPGASDDAVSCAVMLEILGNIVSRDLELSHAIVFIFNGAEENILQASHGFITQHKWANDVRAFLNLEAAGSGGSETVFQVGPGHPWLVHAYAKTAKYPSAHSIAQEIFQSGIIPSDTDFRIYRDFGKIPGLDMAYMSNGYVYHTRFDTADRIPKGCIQRTGDNLLELTMLLANSEELANTDLYRHGTTVFFDVAGIFMVTYPFNIGQIMNSIVVVAVLLSVFKQAVTKHVDKTSRIRGRVYIRTLVVSIVCQLVGWGAAVVASLSVGYLLGQRRSEFLFGRAMFWYARPMLALPIYGIPAALAILSVHILIRDMFLQRSHRNLWLVEPLCTEATNLILSFLLAYMTYKQLTSSYAVLLQVVFPFLLKDRVSQLMAVRGQPNSRYHWRYLFFIMAALTLPYLITLAALNGSFELFIPVMGRIGTGVQPDLVVAVLCASYVIVTTLHWTSLIYVGGPLRKLRLALALTWIVAVAAVLFTSIGFPYSGDLSAPRAQRQVLHSLWRRFHNEKGELVNNDHGTLILSFDYNGLEYFPANLKAGFEETTCDYPNCGLPYYFPMLRFIKRARYRREKGTLPSFGAVEHHFIGKQILPKDGSVEYGFEMKAPDRAVILIAPLANVSLVGWSLIDHVPPPTYTPPLDVSTTYFVYYSYGQTPAEPYKFTLRFLDNDANRANDGPMFQIVFCSHLLHGRLQHNFGLGDFIDKFPDYIMGVGWSATYDHYIY